MTKPVLVWLRQDQRLADHPALTAALAKGVPVALAYVLDEATMPLGGASKWWLGRSLAALARAVEAKGGRLILRRGQSIPELIRLAAEIGAGAVYWNRRYEPAWTALEPELARALEAEGLEPRRFRGSLLFEPGSIRAKGGGQFQIFAPFWRACQAQPEPHAPHPVPATLPLVAADSLPLESLGLEPRIRWWAEMDKAWTPGEAGAAESLATFVDEALSGYAAGRNRPDLPGTSRLSPHLAHGEVTPRQIWHAVRGHGGGEEAFLRELGWREFSGHLLAANPDLASTPLRPEFAEFPWAAREDEVAAWRRGGTGYPIVDAGMRQLWRTGWMHNRVRMIAGSFLVKDLLAPWQTGEDWFRDTLVDWDMAANAASWQWVAGCGIESAPFFRVFNPVLQGEKFDPRGTYVRHFVPELARLPDAFIHKPWTAPPAVLAAAGVRLGENYSRPIIDHSWARDRALATFKGLREG